MPIDPTKLENLLAISRTEKPQVCEVLKVDWSPSVTKYYATSAFDRVPPFTNIKNYLDGESVDARLIQSGFHSFETNADLTTENISLTFADADEDIKTKFQTYGSGIKCELFYFYPQVDLFWGVWWGVFNQPETVGRGTLFVQASNGFKSRELLMPRRMRPPDLCTSIFGGEITDVNEYRGIGCRYNRQFGGTIGNLNGGVPFTSCPKDDAACTARGMNPYMMKFPSSVAPVVSDPNNPSYLARTKGNADRLTQPIRVIYGQKYVRDLPILLFRNENTASNPDHSWVRLIAEVGEGPVGAIDNVKISLGTDAAANAQYLQIRKGDYAQTGTNYGGASNYSGTALLMHVLGYVPANTPQSSVTTMCRVKEGYNKVRAYSDEDSYVEQYENNRIWCLLDLYTNLRWGRGYSYSKFWIEDFIDAANWTAQYVRFTATRADGSTSIHDHYRSKFDAILEGRQTQEQIKDICRAGRVSVPFQYEGRYSIATLRKWTTEELEDCRVFSDKGENRNIVCDDGAQSIRWTQIPDSQLTNQITLKFEDGAKQDREVTLFVEDKVQKQKAAKALGDVSMELSKQYFGTGIRVRNEAVKFAYSLLNLGEFDSGGIKNNLRIEFDVFYEQTLGLKQFDVIKVESDILTSFGFDYFRLIKPGKKKSDHKVTLTLQAYPVDYYATFETPQAPPPPPTDFPPDGETCRTTLGTITYEDGQMLIPIEPCI